MAAERRSTETVRRDISTERDQLAGALTDLRTDVRSAARKLPLIATAGVALGAVAAAVKRRRERRRRSGLGFLRRR